MKQYRAIYTVEDEELGHGEWHTDETQATLDGLKWTDAEDMLDTYDRGFRVEEMNIVR